MEESRSMGHLVKINQLVKTPSCHGIRPAGGGLVTCTLQRGHVWETLMSCFNRCSLCSICVKWYFHPINRADEERESWNISRFLLYSQFSVKNTGPPKESTGISHKIEREELGARAFIVVSTGRKEQARACSLGLASLNNSTRLWGIRTAPSCLPPDPGVTKAGG